MTRGWHMGLFYLEISYKPLSPKEGMHEECIRSEEVCKEYMFDSPQSHKRSQPHLKAISRTFYTLFNISMQVKTSLREFQNTLIYFMVFKVSAEKHIDCKMHVSLLMKYS